MSDTTVSATAVPAPPASWRPHLAEALAQDSFCRLRQFLQREREEQTVFPPLEATFAALEMTPLDRLRVVILGQDPYHDDGQAHGLSFSVPVGQRIPPSLRNIIKELQADLDESFTATHGDLRAWAEQGVLLLNTVLTVRAHQANSHRGKGWEPFTDQIIQVVNERPAPSVFVLWGAAAAKKRDLIDESRHAVIESAHPSPLSARRGFFGSRPFSAINAQLARWGSPTIDWSRPWHAVSHGRACAGGSDD